MVNKGIELANANKKQASVADIVITINSYVILNSAAAGGVANWFNVN